MKPREFERLSPRVEIELEGPGLHTGASCSVLIAPGRNGIRFSDGERWFKASPENVTDTRRSTMLGTISTIEHLMSAFAGLGVTDADVLVKGGELPAADGCSQPYTRALLEVGMTYQGVLVATPPFSRVYDKTEDHSIAVAVGNGHWRYDYINGTEWPRLQSFEIELSPESYMREVAPARTFGLEEELPIIRQAGLARGLDENSALVIGTSGYLNASRFDDEPARHKLLDLIGDLYLSGFPILGLDVIGERSGHRAHVGAAAKLVQHCKVELLS